jgi:hypothetical protein
METEVMRNSTIRSSALRLLPLAAALAVALAPGLSSAAPLNAAGARRFDPDHFGADYPALQPPTQRQQHLARQAPSNYHAGPSVTNCKDSGAGSLRNAVAAAVSGDQLDLGSLHCSKITLTSGAIDVVVDDLKIRGPLNREVIVDGNHTDRVLNHSGTGTLSLSNVTLTHGHATTVSAFNANVSGGCLNSHGSIALDHAAIVACDASSATGSTYGGGAHAQGYATLVSSLVANNTVHAARHAIGAGVLADYGTNVRGSLISGNAAIAIGTAALEAGASVDASMGGLGSIYDLDISDSVIHGNTVSASTAFADQVAVANEGGVFTFGTLTMVRSTISDNVGQAINTGSSATAYAYAFSDGGGARARSFMVSDSTISGNSTSAIANNPQGVAWEGSTGGGARTFGQNGTVSFTNSTVSGNSSTRSGAALAPYGYAHGGGIYGNGAAIVLTNSTVTSNKAEQGGGIYQYNAATMTADSTIVAGNISSAGGGDFRTYLPTTVSGSHNLITSASATLTLPVDTLSGDPKLAPLAWNGGFTLTHALQRGSPAIDAGSNIDQLPYDQRGKGFARKVGPATDIGAYEKR